MRNVFEFAGLILGSTYGVNLIGEMDKYKWYDKFFLFFFIMALGVFFGVVFRVAYGPLAKIYDKWIGKKKPKRLY